MGLARKSGTKSLGFIDSVSNLFDAFYISVVQNLKSWRPPAPRIPTDSERTSDAIADAEDPVSAEILHELGASVVPNPLPQDPEAV
jgi:hypothetical protein